MQWIYNNIEESFFIDINTNGFLGDRDIDFTDINEATYLIKKKRNDCDSDAIYTATINNGITTVPSDEAFAISFVESDFDSLVVGRYYAGLRIKTGTMTAFLETELEDDNFIVVNSFFVDCL